MKQGEFIIITKPEDMDKFFPVGTKLQLPHMKVEVVTDPLAVFPACKGCPFDSWDEEMSDYCLNAVCRNMGEDGKAEFIKFKKLEG